MVIIIQTGHQWLKSHATLWTGSRVILQDLRMQRASVRRAGLMRRCMFLRLGGIEVLFWVITESTQTLGDAKIEILTLMLHVLGAILCNCSSYDGSELVGTEV